MRVEGNNFERHHAPDDVPSLANMGSYCEGAAAFQESGGWLAPASDVRLRFGVGCGLARLAPLPPRPYEAAVEEAGLMLREKLYAEAGNTLHNG